MRRFAQKRLAGRANGSKPMANQRRSSRRQVEFVVADIGAGPGRLTDDGGHRNRQKWWLKCEGEIGREMERKREMGER